MQLLAVSDIHGDLDAYEWFAALVRSTGADVAVLAGDLTSSRGGSSSEEKRIRKVLERTGRPVLFIMGNDDPEEWKSGGCFLNINQTEAVIDGVQFIGYQYTNPFVGGPFEKTEKEQESDFSSLRSLFRPDAVFITHGPPYGVLDAGMLGGHVGSRALKNFVDTVDPLFHIFGHIHESHGVNGSQVNVSYAVSKACCLIGLPQKSVKFISRTP